ncbi:unnamed protein product [Arabidopsis thaliana]|jgi:bacteriorhodopsin|uniref:Transmembrane protein n=3 Tax=Arabidopsis thaliana TaxID=3702 RepID=Q1G3X3_ARATH|nr:uncharacterized protein AT1G68238 [Arabidopsis thaliana]ABF59307.1 unknown protein [Arabidopsis thaliana]AEE34769.1 transmembrane protein [Arabidopsis thaliana]CAD5316630.1 unnamed protein product [Arabidopsis thaliana]|eukprot:NP_001117569.1 transmembrane protein [Arabidopsis thaliana]
MVRGELAVIAAGNGEVSLYIWAAVVAFSVIAAVIFSCSDRASKPHTNDDVNGSSCAAGCGGGCGG